MIAEDYVSFETAKLLLEKGYPFNDCWNWYIDFDNISSHNDDDEGDGEVEINECHYPLISLGVAMKWLREVHNIFIEISVDEMLKDEGYQWALYYNSTKEIRPYSGWEDSYEQACEAAIKYCLENLI